MNIGMILNVALPGAVRQTLRDPALVDPRTYLAPARAEMTTVGPPPLTVLNGAETDVQAS